MPGFIKKIIYLLCAIMITICTMKILETPNLDMFNEYTIKQVCCICIFIVIMFATYRAKDK